MTANEQHPRELEAIHVDNEAIDQDGGDSRRIEPMLQSVDDGAVVVDDDQLPQHDSGRGIIDDISDVTNLDVRSYGIQSDLSSVVSAYAESVHSIPLAEEVASLMSKDDWRARYEDLQTQFNTLCQHLAEETPTIPEETQMSSTDLEDDGHSTTQQPSAVAQTQRKSGWALLAGAAVLLSVILATVLSLPPTPSEEQRAADITAKIQSVSLSTDRKPQCDDINSNSTHVPDQMLCWLIHDDPLQLTVQRNSDHLIQRYALFVIILGQGHPTVALHGNGHECDPDSFNLWRAFWTCDSNNRITAISVPDSGLGLTGTLPEELGLLTHLTALRFPNNSFSGPIPNSISQLTNMQSLRLPNNGFNGTIPESIGQLTKLSFLHLERNQLTGSIPSSVSQMSSLASLHLWENRLTGSIPDMRHLHNLLQLELRVNALTGTIPDSLGQLTLLDRLTLSRNMLNGTLPASLGNLTNISTLWLQVNFFIGTFPSSLGQMNKLTQALLYDNPFLTGDAPFCTSGSTPVIPTLVVDCGPVNCPCCTHCCPAAVDDIPFCTFCFCLRR